MANPEILAVLMLVAVIVALMAGYPVALTLAGTSLIVFAVLFLRFIWWDLSRRGWESLS